MARLKPNEKRVQLSFARPEDVALFEFLAKESSRPDVRRDIGTYIILSLHEAFKGQFLLAGTDGEAPPAPPE